MRSSNEFAALFKIFCLSKAVVAAAICASSCLSRRLLSASIFSSSKAMRPPRSSCAANAFSAESNALNLICWSCCSCKVRAAATSLPACWKPPTTLERVAALANLSATVLPCVSPAKAKPKLARLNIASERACCCARANCAARSSGVPKMFSRAAVALARYGSIAVKVLPPSGLTSPAC